LSGYEKSNFIFLLILDYGYGSDESKKMSAAGYSPDGTSNGPPQSLHAGTMSQQASVQTGLLGLAASSSSAGTPTTVCYEYSYPDSNSNHSKSGFVRPASEHHYEQPMVVFPSVTEDSSIGKPSRSSAEDTTGTTTSRGSTQPDRGELDLNLHALRNII
jgi:hypothetical protein